ncbi:MFS monocarboxylate [Colletotrichum karsti]|uniref:MFS monocarboxylate n=1 Tax=Colletotrichum karsti TaxID=1095194 RepID=A0A9P6IA43_9PEZI|nr:MFS monocarboxylate [Colletotrichum karsti]KAF9879108.1 MFS monocarboxylate [Colletotrichum karsti]
MCLGVTNLRHGYRKICVFQCSRRDCFHPGNRDRASNATFGDDHNNPHRQQYGNQVYVLSQEPVDRGCRAWCVVVGSTAIMIPTFGLMTTIGIFQVIWKSNQLSARSNTEISWIISIYGFLAVLLCGPFGAVFDKYGPRWILTPAATLYAASFLGVAFCTQYWQFFLCFSFAGVGAAALTTSALAVINHWFDKKKGLAMGICTMGGGVGGVIFSVLLRFTTKHLNWMKASLVHLVVICVFLVIGCVMIRPRVLKPSEGKLWDFSCFRRWKFLLFTLSVCGFELVLFVAWGLLPTFSSIVNLGDVFYLMLVFSVGSTLGRVIPGYLTDRMGPFNVTIMMTIITELTMLSLWLPFGSTSAPVLYTVAFLLGFGTGSFVSTAATCLGRLCDVQDNGTYIGCCYAVVSLATLIGNPASQAVLGDGQHGRTRLTVAFLAAILFLSLVSCCFVRWLCLGKTWKWRVNV